MFNPKPQYEVVQDALPIRDFKDYWEEFVVRPPYQRKSVWSKKKKQALLDSLFRRYYVPRIVIREVRRDATRTAREVIDGQQRITTAKEFLADELPLPDSLADIDASLPGATYSTMPPELRRFVTGNSSTTRTSSRGSRTPGTALTRRSRLKSSGAFSKERR